MVFLSQIVGRPVRDVEGNRIGAVRDLIIRIRDGAYPLVAGVVAGRGRDTFSINASQVADISEQGVSLNVRQDSVQPHEREENELLLARDLLDHQLIDLNGRRVVRATDVQLGPAGEQGDYQTVAVDVSPHTPLRRLGLRRFPGGGAGARELLDWSDIEYFASEESSTPLRINHERLSRLHPADIARLIDSVPQRQGSEIMDSLDLETAAETLDAIPAERQADFVAAMDGERAADIVERMAPDDAADLLGGLAQEKARELLDLMEDDASEDVEELLAYEADSAGGLMTPNYATALPDMTVGEAIEHIRLMASEPELIYYVYVVDSLDYDTPLLLGIASLRDMILGGLDRRMDEVMTSEFHHAAPDTPVEEVARLVGEYDLLALPVLDAESQMLGIVTVDDVMETLLPGPWRERIPKLFR